MKHALLLLVLAVSALSVAPMASAGKKGGGATAPGTGSKANSTYVHGHFKKDGTFVEGHRKSTPDTKFENNWTTKGNDNLYTGKDGVRVTPPAKK
jgi:hypothetical protein